MEEQALWELPWKVPWSLALLEAFQPTFRQERTFLRALGLLFGGAWSIASAAQGAQPGDTFYPVKVLFEQARVVVSPAAALDDGEVDDGAMNDVDDLAVGDIDDGAVGDVDDGAMNDVDDLAVGEIDAGAVGDMDDGAVGDVDDGAVGDVDDGAVDDVDDGAVGDVDDGAQGDVDDGAQGDVDDGAQGDVDDGAQGDVDDLGVDLLSMSAHKLYGPKGVGVLYIRGGVRNIPLEPLILGGGQENGLRSGTTNVPAIVGFGEACRIASLVLHHERIQIAALRDQFEHALMANISTLKINGSHAQRLPNTSSLTFPGIDADALLVNLPDVMMGTGSACTSGAIEPSHVLQAIGLSRDDASSTIRASLGRYTTERDIRTAYALISEVYNYWQNH